MGGEGRVFDGVNIGEDNTDGGGGRSEGAKGWTHSATLVTEEVCVAPLRDVYRKVGTQPAWSWGPVGVEVALARRQTMARPYLEDTAESEVRVVEDPPDQIRAVESRGGTVGRGVGSREWGKVRLGEVK
jgi:hypothetical protein